MSLKSSCSIYVNRAVSALHTCRREVLCSFFWTLEERWWNSTAIRPRWANSWFGLDSSANMLKELSSLFSWLASSRFSWGRTVIATDRAWRCQERRDSQCGLPLGLTHRAMYFNRPKTGRSTNWKVIVLLSLGKVEANSSVKANRFFPFHLFIILPL